jgi:hypothetical protein
MRSARMSFGLSALLAFCSAAPVFGTTEQTVSYASKLTLRTHGGILANSGTVGGATVTLGGLTFGYQHFFSQRWGVSAEYQADFDYKNGAIPLRSVWLSSRYYWSGFGTRASGREQGISWSKSPARGFYVAPTLGFSEYFLGTNSETTPGLELTGNFLTLGAAVGADFSLSSSLQLTAEGKAGVLTFAGSDDRFRVSGYLLGIGVSYLW